MRLGPGPPRAGSSAWRFHQRQTRKRFALVLKERARLSREIHDTLVQSLVAQGLRNKAIAMSLGISEETAQVHVGNILATLKAQDRTAAVHVALRRGIIHIG